MADQVQKKGAGLVIKLTFALLAVFLLNEAFIILKPSLAYAAVRAVLIPMVALANTVASVAVVVRPKQSPETRIIGCLGLVASLAIWAFQWFWSGALFGPRVGIDL
jgi:hypothetical protein